MRKTLKGLLIIGTASFVISACSSDDNGGTPPPPMVDCNATGPSISLTATTAVCGEDDGTIEVTVTGGTGTLDVTIDPQPIGFNFSNNTFSDLEPGNYTVEVTDADNCSTSETEVVDFSAEGVSYMDAVHPIVQANCAIDGCHDGSRSDIPNYNNFEEFQSRANNNPLMVRQRVKQDDMPRMQGNDLQPGTPLSDEEKAILFCWIDEGAMDN